MKITILILGFILSFSSYANIFDHLFTHFEDAVITDQQAEELGMMEVEEYERLQLQMQDRLNQINADLMDDERNIQRAKIVIIINEGDRTSKNPEGQTLKLYKDGKFIAGYNVSTGSRKKKTTTSGRTYIAVTPHGFFRPKRAYREYYSYTFFGSLMRYAVFFYGGIATHKTEVTHILGQRASGGCVRTEEDEAYFLNNELLKLGEPHRNYSKENICKNNRCYPRELYTNRYKLYDIDRWNARMVAEKIWTYDALFIVKPGN